MRSIKSLVRKIAPTPYQAMLEMVWKHRLRRYESVRKHVDFFIEKNGLAIQSGPFAGMPYVSTARGSVYPAKLIGSYEIEIHDFIKRIMATSYPVIVDIGCAEGYYAVGFAKHKPNTIVYAFDMDDRAIELCRQLAAKNGVAERVITRGRCDPADLAALPLANSLVFCDCEGFEAELLRPEAIPQLREADVLVELHDCFAPGVTEMIRSRFAATHDIEIVPSRPRHASDWPQIATYSPKVQRLMLHELRFGNAMVHWAFMTPRQRASGRNQGVRTVMGNA
jgi:hypothetical protein